MEWLLLASEPVRTQAGPERVLRRYRLRLRSEDWHRVMNSGCKVENLANRSRERLELSAAIGWRLHLMVLLGRETPELPAETLFSDVELRVLHDFAQGRGKPRCGIPAAWPTLHRDVPSLCITMFDLSRQSRQKL